MPRQQIASLVFCAVALLLPARAIATPLYHVVGLGGLPGATLGTGVFLSGATGINDAGQIVGYATNSAGNQEAFLYTGGSMIGLGTLGGTTSSASGINNSGQVVGSAQTTGNNHLRSFLYSDGTMTDLGALTSTSSSEGAAINDVGQVVGTSILSSANSAVLFSNGSVTSLWTGGVQAVATAVSDNGEIAGEQVVSLSNTNGAKANNLIYNGGVVTNFGLLPAPYNFGGGPFAMNNSGEIAGVCWNQGETVGRAYLYENGIMTDLGVLPGFNDSVSHGINSSGEVVGILSTTFESGTQHAFVYQKGTIFDLNTLLDGSSAGWKLTEAYGVNDNGDIVGFGVNPAGVPEAFLLTPVPEPLTLTLLAIGALALGGFAVRRRPVIMDVLTG